MADELRPDAIHIVERVRAEGIRHIAMICGDRRSVAERIGREIGVDRVTLEVVRGIGADRDLRPVITVGDGVNHAPAPTMADLGIAMGAAGATVSSATADAVITVITVDRVADAVHAGRRALLHCAPQRAYRLGAQDGRYGWPWPPPATCRPSPAPYSRK
jgi:P-type E1-E2 ATPase